MAPHVLVAEDSRTQAAALQGHLEEAGYTVAVAADGEQALAQLQQASFDVVLSDIVMPGIDGFALCQRIKEDPQLEGLPVVLLTSLTDPMEIVHALDAGADNFIRKPYDPEQLLERVRTILLQRSLRASGHLRVGVELLFLGRHFAITAERQQILDLLMSTFEDLVQTNHDLRSRREELASAQRALEAQLRAVETERERLQAVLSAIPETLLILDGQRTVTAASEVSHHLLGRPTPSLIGRRIGDICRFVDRQGREEIDLLPLRAELTARHQVEMGSGFDTYLERPDRSTVPVIIHAVPVPGVDPEAGDVVVMLREIGGLAYHDPLTKLPNHALFADRLVRSLERSLAHGRLGAVLVVKLDRLRVVTETLGQAASDRVLADAAERLTAVLAAEATRSVFANSSGGCLAADTLAVVLEDAPSEVDAVRFGQAVLDRLRGPYRADAIEVPMTVSIGIAIAAPGKVPMDLLRAAGAAAAAVESRGGSGIEVFDPRMRVRTAERLHREVDLHRAVEDGHFLLYYQPEMDVTANRPTGVEALVRWQHPEHGLISPAEFIPLAEETGLIVPIGRWVISEACRQAAAWQRRLPGGEQFTVAVNLSARQLTDPTLLEHLRGTLEETGINPASLLLEITESAVMHAPERAGQTLRDLRGLGVRLGIDDFGTGYSSLLYLRSFPVDLLKIDRVFVDGMCEGVDDAAIVKGTIQLAHAMDLRVVAEGVETKAQLAKLRALGCDMGQGYYWSRPLPPDQLESWWDSAMSGATPAR